MSQDKGIVILVDDDKEMNSMTTEFLQSSGFQVKNFFEAKSALEFLNTLGGETDSIDLIISDISMPGIDGLQLASHLKNHFTEIPTILITAFASIESAIEATKQGVFDYIAKPFKLQELQITIDRAVSFRNLKRENDSLKKKINSREGMGQMLGKSKSMQNIFQLVERVAKATANVLITGPSGTGKEMVARSIHDNGPRKSAPFVAINCSAIPENLLESELFGHAKGSFTGAIANKRGLFEEASGGTIFLDEIGDLQLSLQAKLLRVIQEKKVKPVGDNQYKDIDVRIISATHKDLKESIRFGNFREDLFYRLSVIPITLPSLNERREDIPLLANTFLHRFASENKRQFKGFTHDAMAKLMHHKWDGNVRELENLIERIVVLAPGNEITARDIPFHDLSESSESFFNKAVGDLPTVHELEKRYIQLILEKTANKKEKAAKILGINRRTLYRKEREYGLVDSNIPFYSENDRLSI